MLLLAEALSEKDTLARLIVQPGWLDEQMVHLHSATTMMLLSDHSKNGDKPDRARPADCI